MKIARGPFWIFRHVRNLKDGLVWLQLLRRPGPLGAIALVGAGAAVGAGLVLLFSPTSGREMRRTLRRRTGDLSGIGEKLRRPFQEARSGLSHLAKEKVDDLTRDLEIKAEGAEEKVSEALRTARDAVKHKLD